VSKLVAGRQKDIEFANALIEANIISVAILKVRAEMLEVPGAVIARVVSTLGRLSS
jgi:hypothetical protein